VNKTERAALSLGSNLPFKGLAREEILYSAFGELQKHLDDCRLSPLYETAPLYVTKQGSFLNGVVCGLWNIGNKKDAAYGAGELLALIHEIEAKFGRNRAEETRWGQRTLDIDILLFGDFIVDKPDLHIPHLLLKERAFALRPLLDLWPDAAEPETGMPYRDVLALLPPQEIQPFSPLA
jgi:2-amino-4-hydroxy-6-hydroxymethyldihydropteridine diphosphokinase